LTFSEKYELIVLNGEAMNILKKHTYLDYLGIMDVLKGYASPKSKLTTMIKKGDVIKVRRGLYLPGDAKGYSLKTLANVIYGPSYVSFESALSYYGFIPEKVPSITSACFNKNKNRTFETPVGTFIYRYINARVYAYGICRLEENDSPFLIASPEKALCDTLSKVRGIKNAKSLEHLLREDLRVDSESLAGIDLEKLKFLAGLYQKKILTLLCTYFEK
jgi:predicted transcriptional regulator of viral defense system